MQLRSQLWIGCKLRSTHSNNPVSAFFSKKSSGLTILTPAFSPRFRPFLFAWLILERLRPSIVTSIYRGVVRQNGLEDASVQMMNFTASTQTASATCKVFFSFLLVTTIFY
jgi:hypothetical protein